MPKNEIDEVVSDIEKDVAELGEEPEDIDTTDWKAEALRARGIAKRNQTRLEKLKKAAETKVEPAVPPEEKKVEKSEDYAELAKKSYLNSRGIPEEDHDYLFSEAESTGKKLSEIVGFRYVQEELKNRKDTRASENALPEGSKRSASAARDQVEYWLAKGELPPASETELRRKVVAARIEREKDTSRFTDSPVV